VLRELDVLERCSTRLLRSVGVERLNEFELRSRRVELLDEREE